jgi:hypothetical protein
MGGTESKMSAAPVFAAHISRSLSIGLSFYLLYFGIPSESVVFHLASITNRLD